VDLDPLNVRRGVGILTNARRTLLPLPLVDRPAAAPRDVLPPFAEHSSRAGGVSVASTASGGSAVAMVGMARAFEEARLRPEAISVSSAAALWGAMWAAGMTADEMADYSLSWRPESALGVQWAGLPRLGISAVRGFGGLARGEALERLFPRHVWRMSASETEIPVRTVARDIDRDRLEVLGSEATPDLTLGELVRVAVAPPRRGEAVRVEGRFYGSSREPAFYDLFLDRRRWPELIRDGYAATRKRLSESPS
jgi:NTE family protein